MREDVVMAIARDKVHSRITDDQAVKLREFAWLVQIIVLGEIHDLCVILCKQKIDLLEEGRLIADPVRTKDSHRLAVKNLFDEGSVRVRASVQNEVVPDPQPVHTFAEGF